MRRLLRDRHGRFVPLAAALARLKSRVRSYYRLYPRPWWQRALGVGTDRRRDYVVDYKGL